MRLFRIPCALWLVTALLHSSLFSQLQSTQNAVAAPTASSFAYPQSVFLDSPNGHIWISDFDNHRVLRFDVSSLTTVNASRSSSSPSSYGLGQNYPNPFNPVTHIAFSPRTAGVVVLTVHNLLGQQIAVLFNEVAAAKAVYTLSFDGKDLPGGIYIYSLRSADGYEAKMMCLLK
jgi:hypothetical protein